MTIEQLSSAILAEIYTGLRGITSNIAISEEQLADEIIVERTAIITELYIKGMLPVKDLQLSIDCITLDIDKLTSTCNQDVKKLLCDNLHFEIPQIITLDSNTIFVGSIDKSQEYKVYTNTNYKQHKYARYGGNKPYVYIKTTPNKNNKFDCYLFNAPYTNYISLTAIFKDPRDLVDYTCCQTDEYNNLSILSSEILKRITEKKMRYYRQLQYPILPNDQTPR